VVAVLSVACIAHAQDDVPTTFGGLLEATIETMPSDFISLSSTLANVYYTVGDLRLQLDARLTDSTFDTLTLFGTTNLANINLTSSASFNPSTAEFLSWQSSASFTLFELAISDILYITSPQTESYNQFTLSGTVNDIALQTTTKLGICPLEFWETSFCGSWLWEPCGANLGLCLTLNDVVGFESLSATLSDYVLFEDLFGIRGSLDASLTFALDEKSLAPSLRLQPDWFLCPDIELLSEFTMGAGPLSIESLLFYGIRGSCTFFDRVTFSFADSLDDSKNSALTGYADYFERFGIEGPLPSCCGAEGSFELNAYFERPPAPSGTLFGLGLFTAAFDLQLFQNFGFAFEAEFPTASSDWWLAFRFRVLW